MYTYRIQVFVPMELNHVNGTGGPKFLEWANEVSKRPEGRYQKDPMIRVAEHVVGLPDPLKTWQGDKLREAFSGQFPECEVTIVEIDATGQEVRRMSGHPGM